MFEKLIKFALERNKRVQEMNDAHFKLGLKAGMELERSRILNTGCIVGRYIPENNYHPSAIQQAEDILRFHSTDPCDHEG